MKLNDNVMVRLRERQEGLTRVEKLVAQYVSKHMFDIPKMSIQELARASDTSEASIIRFCKTLGYSGYRDFIVSASASLGSLHEEGEEKEYTDICPGDNIDTIINNVSANNCKSIEDTVGLLSKDMVTEAILLLRRAERIVFFGLGASAIICEDAALKFSRINKNPLYFPDTHSQLMVLSLLSSKDVVVLVSNSGTTNEVIEALHIVQEHHVPTIAITRYARSPLADGADIVLPISTPEITLRSGAMGSRIAMLNIVDILFAGVASSEYGRVKMALDRTHEVLKYRHRG